VLCHGNLLKADGLSLSQKDNSLKPGNSQTTLDLLYGGRLPATEKRHELKRPAQTAGLIGQAASMPLSQ
jgi:hypothetical protein